jgi:hypothetical protein
MDKQVLVNLPAFKRQLIEDTVDILQKLHDQVKNRVQLSKYLE